MTVNTLFISIAFSSSRVLKINASPKSTLNRFLMKNVLRFDPQNFLYLRI